MKHPRDERFNPYGGGRSASRYQVPATLNPPTPPKATSEEDTSGSSSVGGLFAGLSGIFSGAAKGLVSALAGSCAKPRTPKKAAGLSQPVGIGSPPPGALDETMEPFIDQDRSNMMRTILNDREISVQMRKTMVKAMLAPGGGGGTTGHQSQGNPTSFSVTGDSAFEGSHTGSVHNSTRPFASFSTDRSRQRGPIRALNTGEVLNSPAPSAPGLRSRGAKGTPPGNWGPGYNGLPRRAMSVAAGGPGRRDSPMSRPLTSMSHRRHHSASKLRPLNPRLGPIPNGRLSSRRLPAYHPTYDRSSFSWERLHKRSRYERDANGQLKLNFTDPMVDRALKRHKASPGGYKPNLAFTKEEGDNYASKSIFSGVTKSRLRPKALKTAPPAVSSPATALDLKPKHQSPAKPQKLSFSKVSNSNLSSGSMDMDKSNTSVGSAECLLASQQPMDSDHLMLSGPMSPSKISLPKLTDSSSKAKKDEAVPISLFDPPKSSSKKGGLFSGGSGPRASSPPASSSTSSLFGTAPKMPPSTTPVAGASLFGGDSKKPVVPSIPTSSLFGDLSPGKSSGAKPPNGKKGKKRRKSSPLAVPKPAPANTPALSLFGGTQESKDKKKLSPKAEEKKAGGPKLFPTLFGKTAEPNGKENKPDDAGTKAAKPGSGKVQISKESPFASVAATSAAEKAIKPAEPPAPAAKAPPKMAVSFACRQAALLRIKVQEHYEEKIKKLYKTHCKENMETKMTRALKKFEKYKPNREEHDFYVKLCDNYNVDPGPPYTGVDPEPEDEPEPSKTESNATKALPSTNVFSFSAPSSTQPPSNPFSLGGGGDKASVGGGKIGAGLFAAATTPASNGQGAKKTVPPPPAVIPPPPANKQTVTLANPFLKPPEGKKPLGFNMAGSPFKPSPFSSNGPGGGGAKDPKATTGNLFGSAASKETKTTTSNLFGGGASSGNLFGTQAPKTTGPSLFGNGGSASQPKASSGGAGGLFGNSQEPKASTSLFGNSQPTTSSQPTNLFGGNNGGSNTTNGNPFAMSTNTNKSSGSSSLFGGGGSSNSQNTNPFGGGGASNPFGTPATNSPGGMFGNSNPAKSNPFANSNNNSPANPFASGASGAGSPFGGGGGGGGQNRGAGAKFSLGRVSSKRGRGRRPIVRGKRSIKR